jgi:hypothetical protein
MSIHTTQHMEHHLAEVKEMLLDKQKVFKKQDKTQQELIISSKMIVLV